MDFFVKAKEKFPPVTQPKPKYSTAQKDQFWQQFRQTEQLLKNHKQRLTFLTTQAPQQYQAQINRNRSYLNRYTHAGRVSKSDFEQNLRTSQYQSNRLRQELQNLERRYNYGRHLHWRQRNMYYWKRSQLHKQLQNYKRNIAHNQNILRHFTAMESAQSQLQRLGNTIQNQKNIITNTLQNLTQLNQKLLDDPSWFRTKLQTEYNAKFRQIRTTEALTISQINRNTYQYYRRWGRRHYRSAMEQARRQARATTQQRIKALAPLTKTLQTVHQSEVRQKALFNHQKAEQAAKASFYTQLQTKSASVSKAWNYVKKIHQAADESVFFAAEKQNVSELNQLETMKKSIRNELVQTNSFQQKISQLKQKISQPNSYSYEEYIARNKLSLLRGYIPRRDSFIRDRRNIGRGQNYWNQRYSRYVRSVGESKQGHSLAVVATLKRLAQLAHEERLQRYQGWSNFYRVHPLQHQAQQIAWQQELAQLESAEAKRKNQLQSQLDLIDKRINSAKANISQNNQWLNQSAAERAENAYTDEIVTREIEIESLTTVGAQDLRPDQVSAADLTDVLAQQRANQLFNLDQQLEIAKPVAKTLAQIQRFDGEAAVAGIVKQMHYWDSSAGQRRKESTYDNQAIKAGISKHNTVHYAGGSYDAQQAGGGIKTASNTTKLSGKDLLAAVKNQLDAKRAVTNETDLQKRVRMALEKKRGLQLASNSLSEVGTKNNTAGTDPRVSPKINPTPSQEDIQKAIAEKKARLAVLGQKARIQLQNHELSASDKSKLFTKALVDAVQDIFPGKYVGQSLQTMMINDKMSAQLATAKARLKAHYRDNPTAQALIDQMSVEDLLLSYPETADILKDLGLITFELVGGQVLKVTRIFGKLITPIAVRRVGAVALSKAKGYLDDVIRAADQSLDNIAENLMKLAGGTGAGALVNGTVGAEDGDEVEYSTSTNKTLRETLSPIIDLGNTAINSINEIKRFIQNIKTGNIKNLVSKPKEVFVVNGKKYSEKDWENAMLRIKKIRSNVLEYSNEFDISPDVLGLILQGENAMATYNGTLLKDVAQILECEGSEFGNSIYSLLQGINNVVRQKDLAHLIEKFKDPSYGIVNLRPSSRKFIEDNILSESQKNKLNSLSSQTEKDLYLAAANAKNNMNKLLIENPNIDIGRLSSMVAVMHNTGYFSDPIILGKSEWLINNSHLKDNDAISADPYGSVRSKINRFMQIIENKNSLPLKFLPYKY